MFHGNLDPELWSPANYEQKGNAFPLGKLEYVMVANPDCFLCIENNNLGMLCCFTNGQVKFSYGSSVEFAHIAFWDATGFKGDFKEIGYKVTKARQCSLAVRPGSIAACLNDGKVYSGGMLLGAEFDLLSCDKIKTNYAGYKDAVENNAYGIVYYNGGVYLVHHDNIGTIQLLELGRRLQ